MRVASVCVWIAVAALAGCAAKPGAATIEPDAPAPFDEADYRAVYDAAVATLRDRGFRVDRQDYRFGHVTTQPLDSPTVFEPWRPLNSNAAQVAASTAGHLQRRVNVTLSPLPDQPQPRFGLSVEVVLERKQLPLRRLTGTAERNRIDSLRSVPAEWEERGITAGYAEPIGRDAEMERTLTSQIMARAEAK